ncbi:hypothetical protein T492DRAFT_99581 [Pavlovales sp. CCMP2436]|nr:hypothetical protein T492DRAFT_99581 [Pavlovales sp. CCMP2436]
MVCFCRISPLTNVWSIRPFLFLFARRRNRVPYGCLEVGFGAASSGYGCNMGRGCYVGGCGVFAIWTHLLTCVYLACIFFICKEGATEYPMVAWRPGLARLAPVTPVIWVAGAIGIKLK